MSSNTINFHDMQERNEQTLTDIQGLQSIEQELFNKLNSGLNDNTLTSAQKNDLISKINEVSQMRINLYKNLNSVYSFFETNITSSNAALGEQIMAVSVVEQELNEAKNRLDNIEKNTNNKMRMVEINTYYGDKYSDHTSILKIVVMFCIPILFLTILSRGGLIPNFLYNICIVVLFVWGIILVGYKLIQASSHSNMNYDEYTWKFDKSSAPPNSKDGSTASDDPWGNATTANCIGQQCCYEGTDYVESVNQCIPSDIAASMAAADAAAKLDSLNKNSTGGIVKHKFGIERGGFAGL